MKAKPERRLWSAVVLLALQDAERFCQHMKSDMELYGCTSKKREFELRAVYHEIKTEWFEHICDWIDIPHERVIKNFRGIEEKYSMSSVIVIGTDEFKGMKRRNQTWKS